LGSQSLATLPFSLSVTVKSNRRYPRIFAAPEERAALASPQAPSLRTRTTVPSRAHDHNSHCSFAARVGRSWIFIRRRPRIRGLQRSRRRLDGSRRVGASSEWVGVGQKPSGSSDSSPPVELPCPSASPEG
jgi:hypothetical protein